MQKPEEVGIKFFFEYKSTGGNKNSQGNFCPKVVKFFIMPVFRLSRQPSNEKVLKIVKTKKKD